MNTSPLDQIVAQLRQQLAEANTQISSLDADLTTARNTIAALKQDKETLQKTLSERESVIEQLQENVNELTYRNNLLTIQLQNLEDKVNADITVTEDHALNLYGYQGPIVQLDEPVSGQLLLGALELDDGYKWYLGTYDRMITGLTRYWGLGTLKSIGTLYQITSAHAGKTTQGFVQHSNEVLPKSFLVCGQNDNTHIFISRELTSDGQVSGCLFAITTWACSEQTRNLQFAESFALPAYNT